MKSFDTHIPKTSLRELTTAELQKVAGGPESQVGDPLNPGVYAPAADIPG
jgi:hypothetical protein